MRNSLRRFGQIRIIHTLCLWFILFVLSLFMLIAKTHAEPRENIIWLGSFRNSVGAAWYFSPADQLGFQYDLTVGGHAVSGTIVDGIVRPLVEIGYSRHGGSVINGCGHYLVAGAGLSLGSIEWATTVIPSFIVGDSEGDTVYGVRSALRSDFFFGIWSMELAHEWRSVRQKGIHSMRAMLAIDIGTGLSWAFQALTPRAE